MSQDQKTALWLTPWLAPQRTLPGILRWSRFYDHGNRKQDGLQHAVSITFLGMMVLDRIASSQKNLDTALILSALPIHDLGEGLLRRDIPWPDKGPAHDVAEYEAFMALVRESGREEREMRDRFLLQFALKGTEHRANFPPDARAALEYLAEGFRAEAQIFEAIEYLDHMFYIAEQIESGGRLAEIFAGEIHTVIDVLSYYANEIPGFDTVWSPELDAWARSLMPQDAG
jgi:5'-deoxynucleotidase YfbR-like HD superfamily hydrolase